MDSDASSSTTSQQLLLHAPWRRLQRTLAGVLGVALAFPAFKLAWPWPREASLRGDLYPEMTGTAIAALATLPMLAVIFALRRAPRPAWALLLVGFGAAALFGASRQPPTDTMEFDRWRLLAATCFTLALGGAALDERGRLWFARATTVVGLVALLPALADAEHQYTGVLGNTGSISEAALIGAAVGAVLAFVDRGVWRWVGGACTFAFAFYAGLAPVFAGGVALMCALFAGVVASKSRRSAFAVAALALVVLFGAGRVMPRASHAPTSSDAPVVGVRNTGGFEVRRRIWARIPSLLEGRAMFGVGPGQFAAQFPPHRDPEEIEISSLGRTLPGQETEVHHAHNDYLQAFCDAGLVGGALFVALLAFATWRAFRSLASDEPARAALAVGWIAVAVNGALREPLTHDPLSATLAFAALGGLCGGGESKSQRPALSEFAFIAVASIALVLSIPRAVAIGVHGRALRAYFESGAEPQRLDFALGTRPDSVIGRTLLARIVEEREGVAPGAETVQAWTAVLELRPHSLEARMQLGLAFARSGRIADAREQWRLALELDPRHPGLLRNLARLEARDGDVYVARELLERMNAPVERALMDYAVGALQDLELERGWMLLGQVDARWQGLSAASAHHFARNAPEGLDELAASALEGSAHVAWAREHGERGDGEAAVRSYRQAKRCLAKAGPDGAPSWSRALHLEFAAALALAGRPDEARQELGDIAATPAELLRLPSWAGQALLDARLLVR